ncbi:MAG: hypothetical protein JJ895_11390 [Balneolaceae bacterium]|nr:hypothetical protein [Balneolaceae bacterium]
MNKFPLVEMVAFFCRFSRLETPVWRRGLVRHTKRVRSSHTKMEGGIKKSKYTLETKEGEIVNLSLDHEEMIWELEPVDPFKGFVIDRLLAYVKRHKHQPSESHRIVPLRFELIPKEKLDRKTPIELAFMDRMQPYRFKKGKMSIQVKQIETRHLENVMVTKHAHYVVEDTDGRFYHLVYILDEGDWRFMQEVDEQFLFVRAK